MNIRMLFGKRWPFLARLGKITLILINIIFSIIAVYLSFISLCASFPSNDAGYYLSVVERFNDGYVPYKDLKLNYPPIFIYFFYLFRKLFSSGTFEFYMALIVLLNICTAIIFYNILGFITNRKILRYFSSVVFIIYMYAHKGFMTTLEPFVFFFSLLACLVYLVFVSLKKDLYLIICGSLISISFLSKQFGIAILIPIAGDLIISFIEKRNKLRHFLYLILGILIPLLFFIFLMNIYYHISFSMLYDSIIGVGKDYGKKSVQLAIKYIIKFMFYQKANLYLVFLPFLIFRREMWKKPVFRIFIFGAFAFSIPLYIEQFQHYYIYLCPFFIGLGFYMSILFVDNLERPLSLSFALLAGATMLFFIGSLWFGSNILAKNYNYKKMRDKKKEIYIISEKISAAIPRKAKVLNLSEQRFNYLCAFFPPNMRRWGYKFTDRFNRNELDEALSESEYVLLDRNFISYKDTRKGIEILTNYDLAKMLLEKNLFEKKSVIEGKYEIWKKSFVPGTYL